MYIRWAIAMALLWRALGHYAPPELADLLTLQPIRTVLQREVAR